MRESERKREREREKKREKESVRERGCTCVERYERDDEHREDMEKSDG